MGKRRFEWGKKIVFIAWERERKRVPSARD
jgi:hypothetical protein